MSFKQKTIARELIIEGVGLHTGVASRLILRPADENHGIVFERTDTNPKTMIAAQPQNIILDSGMPRCTTLGVNQVMIHTVEHLMSALWGNGITNLRIEIDAMELPGLDGSSIEYYNRIHETGVAEQDAEANVHIVKRAIGVQANGCSIYVVPSDEFKISYLLDYDHPILSSQFVEMTLTQETYRKEIAPARTFCLEAEVRQLQTEGLGKGANYKNTLVVGEQGVIENELRFSDEFARHKILDFLGDLYILGKPIVGHVFACKSGHYLNFQLLRQVVDQAKEANVQRDVASVTQANKTEYNTEDVMKVLPHRHPFLFVDQVTILQEGRKAIGIKNVTGNEDFFKGHFPTRPVMPGVIMVEAMAQTAGVVVLTNPDHHGKLAFFMAVDKVKFRRVVSPGDLLRMEVEVVRDRSRVTQVEAKGFVGDELAVEADMTFSFTDDEYLDS